MQGTVKWFDTEGKGYGFIEPDEPGAKDVFVHIKAVQSSGLSTLSEGQRVSFDIVTDKRSRKPCANNLRTIADAERVKEEAERGSRPQHGQRDYAVLLTPH